MGPAFFPHPYFGWAFVAVLATMLGLACITDWRSIRIPKWISLSTLALGVLFQLARGAWLGAQGESTWMLGQSGPLVGAIDAFLFALAGGSVAFVLMFGLFAAGGCGGGDVKLFAAVGAWVGAWASLWVFVAAALVLMVLGLVRLCIGAGVRVQTSPVAVGHETAPKHSRWMTYSFPLAVGTLIVLAYYLHNELARA